MSLNSKHVLPRGFLRVRKLGVAQLGGCCGPSSLQRLRWPGGLAPGSRSRLTLVAAGGSLSHAGCWPHTSPQCLIIRCLSVLTKWGSLPQSEWSERERPWWKPRSLCCYFCCVLLTPASPISHICHRSPVGGHRVLLITATKADGNSIFTRTAMIAEPGKRKYAEPHAGF